MMNLLYYFSLSDCIATGSLYNSRRNSGPWNKVGSEAKDMRVKLSGSPSKIGSGIHVMLASTY